MGEFSKQTVKTETCIFRKKKVCVRAAQTDALETGEHPREYPPLARDFKEKTFTRIIKKFISQNWRPKLLPRGKIYKFCTHNGPDDDAIKEYRHPNIRETSENTGNAEIQKEAFPGNEEKLAQLRGKMRKEREFKGPNCLETSKKHGEMSTEKIDVINAGMWKNSSGKQFKEMEYSKLKKRGVF